MSDRVGGERVGGAEPDVVDAADGCGRDVEERAAEHLLVEDGELGGVECGRPLAVDAVRRRTQEQGVRGHRRHRTAGPGGGTA